MFERAAQRKQPAPGSIRPGSESANRAPQGTGRHPLLGLQNSAGNAAVAALISGAPVVQRRASTPSEHFLSAADEKDLPAVEDAPGLVAELATLNEEAAEARETKTALAPDKAARITEIRRLLNLRTIGDEAETLRRNSRKETAAAWFKEVKSVQFLGKSVYVHQLLAERLVMAEAALQSEAPPPDGWVREGHSGLREPGQGLHSLGLAIDLNPHTNPWLVNPDANYASSVEAPAQSRAVRDVIDRAVLLVTGQTPKEADLQSRPKVADRDARVEASYDKLAAASSALAQYFSLSEDTIKPLVEGLGDKDKQKRSVAQWVKVIAADRATLDAKGAAKDWTNPEGGFLDLDKRLVKAMTDSSGAGLTWLGDATTAMGRDIMHFDTRGLDSVHVRRIWNSTQGGSINIGDG
jgi:hypothetical protein